MKDIAQLEADLVLALEALRALNLKSHHCSNDPLNPCWDDRPDDIPGKHWGMGDACAKCNARAAIAQIEGKVKL